MSHDLDPQGDVVLLLFNTNPNFAVWDESLEQYHTSQVFEASKDLSPPSEETSAISQKKSKNNKKKKRTSVSKLSGFDQSIEDVTGQSVQDDIAEYTEALQSLQISETESMEQPSTSMQDLAVQKAEEPELRLRVSSRHLMLASAHFSRLFSSDWKEVTSGTITAKGWDAETFLVLMNMIHGRTRQVPRVVNLESLAKLAVLVDYYDCLEVVEIYSDSWIEKLKSYIPKTYGRNLVLWTLISWVFRKSKLFTRVTSIILEHLQGHLQTLELPIPQRITDAIETQRQSAVDHAIASLHGLLLKFTSDEDSCSFECSSILLGALTKEIDRRQLFSPEIFGSASLAAMTEILRDIRSPKWCSSQENSYDYGSYCSPHGCSLQTHIKPIIANLRENMEGLVLENLVA